MASTISGQIIKLQESDKNYKFYLLSERLSGTVDAIPVRIKKEYADSIQNEQAVLVKGNIKTCNIVEDGRNRLKVFFDAYKILPYTEEKNDCFVKGVICKTPILRLTPSNRQICDLIIAVNYRDEPSCYVPCIAWGELAERISGYKIGTVIEVEGRFQSREYQKKTESNGLTGIEQRTAYEFSVCREIEGKC